MSAPTTVDFLTPFDPTAYVVITGAQLEQLVGGLGPNVGIGLIIVTQDSNGNVPTVPNATITAKWQNYAWLRLGFGSSGVGAALYLWNPNGATDAVLLQWQLANINSAFVGQITGAQIAANTITDNNIHDVSWSKLPSGAAVGGSLVGSMPNPSLATNAVALSNLPVPSGAYGLIIGNAGGTAFVLGNSPFVSAVMNALGTAYQIPMVNAGGTALQWQSNPFISSVMNTIGAANQTPVINAAGNAVVWSGGVAVQAFAALPSLSNHAYHATIAHGLAVVPSRIRVVVRCGTTDGTYAVGDEIDIASFSNSGSVPIAIVADATNITISLFDSGSLAFTTVKKDGSAGYTLTAGAWGVYVYASL